MFMVMFARRCTGPAPTPRCLRPNHAPQSRRRRGHGGERGTRQQAKWRRPAREAERTSEPEGARSPVTSARPEREREPTLSPASLSLPPVPRNSRTFISPPSPSLSESIPRKSHSEPAAAPPIAVERSAEGGGAGAGGGERGHAPRAAAAHSVARRSRGGGASERASVRGSRVRAL